jgi:hypothetical protein
MTPARSIVIAVTATAVLATAGLVGARISPEDACEASKNTAAGKYALCRQAAEATAIKKAKPPLFTKCDEKLLAAWAKAEQKAAKAGTSCIDSVADTAIQSFVTAHTNAVAAALNGGAFADCGNDAVDAVGEQCDGTDLAGLSCTTLGFVGGTLGCDAGCNLDTTGCTGVGLSATGQVNGTFAIKNGGMPVTVPDDGVVEAGRSLQFVDNGDGTVTDLNTGLMWEKKSDDGGLHDKDAVYLWRWDNDPTHDTIWDWLDDINAEGGTGFAGHGDWRIPNVKELYSLQDFGHFPQIDPAFNASCTAACTVLTCSCTCAQGSSSNPATVDCASPRDYWTSTSPLFGTATAITVEFGSGTASTLSKDDGAMRHVRAVRGGL